MGHLGLPFGTPRGRVGTPRSGPDSNGGVVGSSRPRVLFDQSEMVCRSRPTRGRVTAAGQAARVPAPEGPVGGPFTFISESKLDDTITYLLGLKRGRRFDRQINIVGSRVLRTYSTGRRFRRPSEGSTRRMPGTERTYSYPAGKRRPLPSSADIHPPAVRRVSRSGPETPSASGVRN